MSQHGKLVDLDARTRIREDLDATLVVEAAAGTGKTTELVARIIAVLRSGRTTLDRIVAMTFTEKAAGELKLRLRLELERARDGALAALERERFDAALAELELARVGTIHSFCTDVLKERPIQARIDPLFEVAAEDDADRIFQIAFDTWFQAALADPSEATRRILRRDKPTELLRDAGRMLVEHRDFAGAWRRDPWQREPAVDEAIAALRALGALATRGQPGDPLTKLAVAVQRWLEELDRQEAFRARDYDGVEAGLFAAGKLYEWRYKGHPKRPFAADLPRADALAIKDAARAALDTFLASAEADLAACLHAELQPLVHVYTDRLARTGRLDFLDLLVRTRDLVRDDAATRTELATRLTHFFVDELQDTDPLQVEILELLVGADRPGALFVVGDPKQAIYRFRRADVAVYEAFKQRLLARGATLLHLTTSFRAVPSIQAALNEAFATAMVGGEQPAYVPLSPFRAELERPSLVALPVPNPYGYRGEVIGKAIEESYPDAVGAYLDWLVRHSGWGIAARHVCLMFRRMQSFNEDLTRPYIRALEARGLAHVLVGGRAFHEREESIAVRNVLAAIEWPDDRFSVYATLRGPMFAFHDEDLVAYIAAHGELDPLDPRESAWPIGNEIRDALAVIGELHRERNRRPIADSLARLLATTRAHAGFAVWPAGEQALANVVRVLDLARRYEARGATSFRAFVERLAADAERGTRQADATVVEEATEGVRIMTVHAAKGLEFPVVILCDPTSPLSSDRPSRHVDPARRLWLTPIARCTPIELAERTEEIVARDREEAIRLAYVAATRARDLLVVPVVGDEQRSSWLDPLMPVIYPTADRRRARSSPAPDGCPAFGDDSVLIRPPSTPRVMSDSVVPGLHLIGEGAHRVVWWDPRQLELDRPDAGGVRQRQILAADSDAAKAVAGASAELHAEWAAKRTYAHGVGGTRSFAILPVTEAAKRGIDPYPHMPVAIEATAIDRRARPNGTRFGTLVHAILAVVELATGADLETLAANHGRLVAATADEIAHAIIAVRAALAHPIIARARAARELRREVPVVSYVDETLVEGIVDLAFLEGETWVIVDFKSDEELGENRFIYATQVHLYAAAIAKATGAPVAAALLLV